MIEEDVVDGRGGISVALALSLPEGDWKPLILTCTYMVVVFSII